jgi:cytochrome c biogenesis protein CcmG/thiol:disulfide interchange protein DsbE
MTSHRQTIRASVAVLLVLLLACALVGCGGGAKTNADGTAAAPDAPGKGEPGSVAPAYELPDVSGKAVSSAEFLGKVVILDFWATWCPPCREEIPHFVKLQDKYRAQGLEIVGLSLDAGGAKDVEPFAKEYGVNYTMLIANDELAKAYGGIVSIPTTFVVDRQGKIVKRFIGYTPPEVFEATIAPLLATTS